MFLNLFKIFSWVRVVYTYMPRNGRKSKADQALSKVNKLARELRPEVKMIDNGDVEYPIDSGVVVHISGVAQGIDYDDRIGNEVRSQSLELRYTVSRTAAGTFATLPQSMRVMIARMKSVVPGGTIPAITDFLQSADFQSPSPRAERHKNISVIYDKIVDLPSTTLGAKSETVRLKNKALMTFTSTGATIASAGRNHLFIILMANSAQVTTTDNPSFTYSSRIRYTDC